MRVQLYIYTPKGKCTRYTEVFDVDDNLDSPAIFGSVTEDQWIKIPGMENEPEVWVDIVDPDGNLIDGTDL